MSPALRMWLVLVPGVVLAGVAGIGAGVWAGTQWRGNFESVLAGKGWNGQTPMAQTAPATGKAEAKQLYTCSMHPQVIQDHPGACPICHMELVPMEGGGGKAGVVVIDPVMVQNMAVRTAMPELGTLRQVVRAVGTLTEPEQNHVEINLRVNGWITKLYANQEGMAVGQGDPLFELYSPEVTAAADELIAAKKATERRSDEATKGAEDAALSRATEAVVAAARRKLLLMGLTEEQVAGIEKMDKAPASITISSPVHGHVAAKNVIEGSAVKAGEELMKIADRSSMWLVVQVFEQQLGLVKVGASVRARVTAFPGKEFEGRVDFVYPHLDPTTRTAMVRVVLPNSDHSLHENMFAEAEIDAMGGGEGKPVVLVPREAVIDSGVRQLVFVDDGGGKFEAKTVKVGRSGQAVDFGGQSPRTGEKVEILEGITEGDRVVVSGQFLLDSESRVEEAQRKFLSPLRNAQESVPTGGGDDMGDMPGMGGGGGGGKRP